jgi:hypothetical protein
VTVVNTPRRWASWEKAADKENKKKNERAKAKRFIFNPPNKHIEYTNSFYTCQSKFYTILLFLRTAWAGDCLSSKKMKNM